MFYKLATAVGVSLCLALPAVAAQTSQTSSSGDTSAIQTEPTPGMNGVSIRQHILQDLEKDGFTDVKVMPASFVAQAKDKQGNPVTMLISPDSVTTIVMQPSSSSASNGAAATASNR